MQVTMLVENIKCSGCARGIRKHLLELDGVTSVEVDVEQGGVKVVASDTADSQTLQDQIRAQLLTMGYPECGSVKGITAAGAKAKSFVSCAAGKWSK